jgi:hypothetical protein
LGSAGPGKPGPYKRPQRRGVIFVADPLAECRDPG